MFNQGLVIRLTIMFSQGLIIMFNHQNLVIKFIN
jgi:hypothetical protein